MNTTYSTIRQISKALLVLLSVFTIISAIIFVGACGTYSSLSKLDGVTSSASCTKWGMILMFVAALVMLAMSYMDQQPMLFPVIIAVICLIGFILCFKITPYTSVEALFEAALSSKSADDIASAASFATKTIIGIGIANISLIVKGVSRRSF